MHIQYKNTKTMQCYALSKIQDSRQNLNRLVTWSITFT